MSNINANTEGIGKTFWYPFLHGKGSLASGGPVVIMADSPKSIMHLFDIKALAVQTTVSSHNNRQSSNVQSFPNSSKKVFSKINFVHYLYLKIKCLNNISKKLNYAHPTARLFFRKEKCKYFSFCSCVGSQA